MQFIAPEKYLNSEYLQKPLYNLAIGREEQVEIIIKLTKNKQEKCYGGRKLWHM